MTGTPDRIERSIVVNAPPSRVWRALSNAEEFGTWFGANLKGKQFKAGQQTRGNMTIKGVEHIDFDVTVDRVEPESLISWRWHPYPLDTKIDYSKEESTLVTFTLKEMDGGKATLVTVVESGFDKVPPQRRAEAFRMNDGGWRAQLENLQRHASQG